MLVLLLIVIDNFNNLPLQRDFLFCRGSVLKNCEKL